MRQVRQYREPDVMRSLLLCGAAPSKALIAGHFEGCSLRIRERGFSEAINASVALKRPERSFGAMTDSRVSSFTEGSARVYIKCAAAHFTYARANLEMKRKALEKAADDSSLPKIPSWKQNKTLIEWLQSL